jgi:single-stranded-DNA-specific exonuclease
MNAKIKNLNLLLPFVAIGTIADCQSILESTNRLLVKSGLQIMQKNSQKNSRLNPGLKSIIDQTGLAQKLFQNYKLSSQDLAFLFSPILNSSGRMSHARLSISVLIKTESDFLPEFLDNAFFDPEIKILLKQKLETLVVKLIKNNQDRKDNVKSILEEVESQAEKEFINNEPLIWLEGQWSKGIIGLLASSLVSKYSIPVVVIEKVLPQEANISDKSTASLRAPEGYHLPNAIKDNCENLVEKFGGHPCAAGFTALTKNLPKIKKAFKKSLINQKKLLENQKIVYLSTEEISKLPEQLKYLQYQKNLIFLPSDQINQEFLEQILLLDPFGQDFKMPELLFCLEYFSLHWMGSENKHLRIEFNKSEQNSSLTLNIFNIDPEIREILKLKNFDSKKYQMWSLARINQNSWQNKTTLQLIAKNIWLKIVDIE